MGDTKQPNRKQQREAKRAAKTQAGLDASPSTQAVSLKPSDTVAAPQAATEPVAAAPKAKVAKPGADVDPVERARITSEVEEHIKSLGVRICGCGECGETTSRTFKPGHDAKLRARLIKERLAAAAKGVKQAVAATSH